MSHTPIFDQTFDLVIVAAGYAGFAAAMAAQEDGRSVLLLDRRGDLLVESGRMFANACGDSHEPTWRAFVDELQQRGACDGLHIDGAHAEIIANGKLLDSSIQTLYYAHPVALEIEGDALAALVVATKAGLKRVRGRQWIDATERGDIVRLHDRAATPKPPEQQQVRLYLQHADWPAGEDERLGLEQTMWTGQRCLAMRIDRPEPAQPADVCDALTRGLQRLAAEGPKIVDDLCMSHCSVEALPLYRDGHATRTTLTNLAIAAPALTAHAIHTLADRFVLGVEAAAELGALNRCDPTDRHAPAPHDIPFNRTLDADVVVAGGGTGGALATIAAAQHGAHTLCIEPLPFVGGIGAGGGIHTYYFGVVGGLQQTLDRRQRDLQNRFGRLIKHRAFHPDAKKITLEAMLREAGARLMTGCLLYDVEVDDDAVVAAHVATPDGPVRVTARAWIDGTGDGDLAAMAGTPYTFGRVGDGLPHAYSQSSGALEDQHGKPAMRIINFDAGWCDPADPEDLTAARTEGLRQYLLDRFDDQHRVTYIAPAIGLRQARQIETDLVLQLDDLVQGRKFDDVVGYSGCHYDNHAVDYELESDEALFWIWLNRKWRQPMGCETSYRMLLPKGLRNVWLACRALGVSQDAHHSFRMQRDMQRIGEVCGAAAALATASSGQAKIAASRDVDYTALRAELEKTGAVAPPSDDAEVIFNKQVNADAFERRDIDDALVDAVEKLDRGETGMSLWLLYRYRDHVAEQVMQRLNSPDADVSWYAAGVAAMWAEPAAEPRLIRAIEQREYGFDEASDADERQGVGVGDPTSNRRLAPNWLVAVCLLRRCGANACVPALAKLAEDPALTMNARAAIALTLQRLADDKRIDPASNADDVLDQLLATPAPADHGIPQRFVGALAHHADDADDEQIKTWLGEPAEYSRYYAALNATEDHAWQLHLAVARARLAMGLPMHEQAAAYLQHPRSLVRHAFERIAAKQLQTVTV